MVDNERAHHLAEPEFPKEAAQALGGVAAQESLRRPIELPHDFDYEKFLAGAVDFIERKGEPATMSEILAEIFGLQPYLIQQDFTRLDNVLHSAVERGILVKSRRKRKTARPIALYGLPVDSGKPVPPTKSLRQMMEEAGVTSGGRTINKRPRKRKKPSGRPYPHKLDTY